MPKELYFDISSEDSGGSLYRVTDSAKGKPFYYNHSTYDDDKDEMKVFETWYPDFWLFLGGVDERFQMVLQASLIRASGTAGFYPGRIEKG